MYDFFLSGNKGGTTPSFWKEYLSKNHQKIDKKTLIKKTNFVVFDCETTGLNPKRDKILSIGAVKVSRGIIDVSKCFEVYLAQNFSNQDSIKIHGILPNGQEQKISRQRAIEEFLKYIGNSILVGHNIKFDLLIINQYLRSFVNDKLKNFSIDTLTLYKRIATGRNISSLSFSLDYICDEFNIPRSDRHTAAGDAWMTAIILLKFINRLEQQGIITVRDLLKSNRTLL